MKSKQLLALMFFFLTPLIIKADIPGRYELLSPKIPPAKHSLETVSIVEVFAFDCGYCFVFNQEVIPKLQKRFGKRITVALKPIGWRGHDPGRLYFIAEEKGKGHEMMMTIFQYIFKGGLGMQMYSRDKLQFVARQHGLGNEFKTKMDSPAIIRKMNESVQYADSRGIDSTPTLIIEDAMIPDRDYSNLVKIIEALLK